MSLVLPEFTREAKADTTGSTYLTEPWFDIRYAIEGMFLDSRRIRLAEADY